MKLELFFEEFTTLVSVDNETSIVNVLRVLRAYNNETNERINVTAEMFDAIEETIKNIISNI